MWNDREMRVDHVSYAAESDGLQATAERLGERLKVAPVDGGLHPRFGTRNMILPLTDLHFVEVVEVLDHPASFKQPFGQAVRSATERGGGWMSWVCSTGTIANAERRLGRESVLGNRHKPDGTEITWKQLGIRGLMSDPQVPWFIHWDDMDQHPSLDGPTQTSLKGLQIAGSLDRITEWLGLVGTPGQDREDWEPEIDFNFVAPHGTPGLLSVTFTTPEGDVTI